MPLEKQSLNNFLPNGFETLNQEGYKENFSEDKIATGYEKDVPDIVSGPNLNNLIDVVGKNTNTLNNYVEYLNGMPINNVPTTDENGQLNYINLDDKLTKKQITNCILEIPQRIKYTLVDGTLTIKAGSVVIVPYGVEDLTAQYPVGATFINDNFKVYDTQFEDGKFFVWAEVQSDIVSYTSGSTTEEVQFMCVSLTLNTTGWQKNTESGTSATTSQTYTLYYNTNTNLIGITKNTTTPNYTDGVFSFVFLAATNSTSNSWKIVHRVFNGMGYIGSTVWVDKGVKVLIANGRNEDGTLNNIEAITNNVVTKTVASATNAPNHYIMIGADGGIYGPTTIEAQYNETLNVNTYQDNIRPWTIVGYIDITKGVMSNLRPKTTFRAVDFSDKSEVSGWGMPSSKYIDLTLGATGSIYVAPANGWVFSSLSSNKSDSLTNIYNETKRYGVSSRKSSGYAIELILPVAKGDAFSINYDGTATSYGLRFYYAEGEI